MEKIMLTKEEEKELESQLNALSDKVSKRIVAPFLDLLAGQLGLAGWLTWITWNHTAAAVIWTVAVIVLIVSFGAKSQSK
jgi:hypothetical protein